MDWNELREELVSRMDVAEAYASIGVDFSGSEPSSKGWLSCHALGREDKTASAAVNVESGHYRDLGSDGDALSIWDALAKYGDFPTWLDAFKHHAKIHGLSKRMPKKHREEAADKLEFIVSWNSLTIRGMLKKYPEFTEEAIRLTGGVQAKYPAKSKDPTYTVSWPVYGQGLLNVPPIGWVAEACDGSEIQLFQGKGQPAKPTKRVNVGGSKAGLVGRYAIRQLMRSDADPEWIFKVEGMSDLITLQSIIPADQREKVLVVTNSAGCSDTKTPAECGPLFSGHNLVILHDSDEPGQNGAKLWLGMVGKYTKTIRNLILHEDGIADKHGRDLRDWVSQGGTFEALVKHAGNVKPFTAGESIGDDGTDGSLTGPQAILNRLGIVVLGHIGTTNKVSFFTKGDGRCWEIRDISRYKVEDLIMHLGWDVVEENVNTSNEPDPAKVTLPQIRRALAAEANIRRITDDKKLGEGCWDVSGRLVLVGAGEAMLWNGGLKRTVTPFCEDHIFDFPDEPWFCRDWITERLQSSANPDWCHDRMSEACSLFAQWDNWRHLEDSPDILASLVCCTWIQTIWPIRPLVSVSGPTNSGKTVFLSALKAMFGRLALSVSKPSEAGLRQYIGHTARVLMIDEFEADRNRPAILELFRTSSRGSEIIRGTANQAGTRFGLRHIPWVGAIELGLTEAADANRFIQFDLRARPQGAASKLTIPGDEELQEMGLSLLIVAMRKYRKALEYLHPLRSQRFEAHDSRLVEVYSVPIAMISAVMELSIDDAGALLGNVLNARGDETQIQSDEATLIEEIFNAELRLGKGAESETVGNLVSTYRGNGADDALGRNGIAVKKDNEGVECLFMAPRTIRSKMLKFSKAGGERDISQILLRIKGARRTRLRLSGTFPHGILIPRPSIDDLFGGDVREKGIF